MCYNLLWQLIALSIIFHSKYNISFPPGLTTVFPLYSNRSKVYLSLLSQDYYEEIAVSQENKQQLYQLGERLSKASHETKASEIEHKLSMVGERWQHLLDLIGAR